jgi:hypothetical protein
MDAVSAAAAGHVDPEDLEARRSCPGTAIATDIRDAPIPKNITARMVAV